ncbi:hypothetical protein F0231_09110 [Vibrio sp. RE86]|uniref:LapD/MoxY N-terminal periplasmic domain-containing protein n=1 Tax=Vibrio sp. RE86 TaxID=2607605 RepID=UPI00149359E5|nr:LapD/MoxY N-terminal periplasmic domain-containing protein [Vibrio sp. RE86]NOH79902.1 hypothetical protein [Vibrio sp. RE86]
MTLHRKLITLFSIILISLTILTIAITFKATQRHLVDQQTIELHNTSRALGFALTPVITSPSRSHIETMMNSLFDSTLYKQAVLTFNDGRPAIKRIYPQEALPVPQWFIEAVPIAPISKSTSISSDWTVEAVLTTQSNLTFTYIRLWNTTLGFTIIGTGFNLIAIIIFHLFLKRSLAPLNELKDHVVSNSVNVIFTPLKQPNTREVLTLVNAYNTMARNISEVIEELKRDSKALFDTAYFDNETGISNRQYLIDSITRSIMSNTSTNIVVYHFPELSKLKHERRFRELNDEGRRIAATLSQLDLSNITVARLSDAEFAFLGTKANNDEYEEFAQQASNSLKRSYGSDFVQVTIKVDDYASVKTLLTDLNKKIKSGLG